MRPLLAALVMLGCSTQRQPGYGQPCSFPDSAPRHGDGGAFPVCAAPLICGAINDVCVYPCGADADCYSLQHGAFPGSVCLDYYCFWTCNRDADCPLGLSCHASSCG